MNRQPFIVGPTADKVLGFLVGAFAQVIGLIATIVVMFMWAGSDPLPDTQARRDHATSVSIWSGVGCLLPVLVVIAIFVMGFAVFGPHVEIGPSQVPPFPDITFLP